MNADPLALVRALRGEVGSAPADHMRSLQSMICTRLDEIEGALVEAGTRPGRGSVLARALLTLGDQGEGSTPMQLGQALDPSKEGYHAGALGSARLNALRQAGLARKAHFGWWVLTEVGQREVERLRAEGAAA